jgi:heparan-alpha-glucosaminide N-acetyltransferase
MPKTLQRLESIDVFRALTMFLMVFVNDLDGVPGVPEWIKHVGENTDGLGFADTIFPAFLFIVGLSIPFALLKRIQRGDSTASIAIHIGLRGFALLVMGFFHVNLESYDRINALLPKAVWEIIITLSFFLIWLDYPKDMPRTRRIGLQILGVLGLVTMGFLYKGVSERTGEAEGLNPHWWGILGLIGWSYLLCAFIFLLSKGKFWVQVAATVFFILFSIAGHQGWLRGLSEIHHYVWIVSSGSLPALTMGGVVVALTYANRKGPMSNFLILAAIKGGALIALGFLLRPIGGISKIHDTPSWVLICMGISVLVFGLLAWLVDEEGKASWFRFFKPAGTSTLTCYLIPYLLYSIFMLCHFKFPQFLSEGLGGLIRSILVALFVVWLTGVLERRHLRLKI